MKRPGIKQPAIILTALALAVSDSSAQRPDDAPTVRILPPNPQQLGDPDAGYEYLLYGDYIGSGLPLALYRTLTGNRQTESRIPRRGDSANIPHGQNVFTMPSGVDVVAGANCLACHASEFRGELVIGLGNSLSDWTDRKLPIAQIAAIAAFAFEPDAPEIDALTQFTRGAAKMNGRIDTPFRGVNPAFRLEELAAAHRNPRDLSWSDAPRFRTLPETIASDVPAWWHLRKKRALYHNGMGRGDFSKLIQQINVVGIDDAADAERINRGMRDLLAYLHTIEPPVYPEPIDRRLADVGRVVFEENCAGCHGTYGDDESYPNKLVPVETVGTDPVYAEFLMKSELSTWYNESWYATSEPRSSAVPTMAYVAPPLDGIWATAPYFHNGAVPTVDTVLDSTARPTFWRRSFDSHDYDLKRVGWRYTEPDGPLDANTYDTTRRGYGNAGHTFGDDLSEDERAAVIEYLKTL